MDNFCKDRVGMGIMYMERVGMGMKGETNSKPYIMSQTPSLLFE